MTLAFTVSVSPDPPWSPVYLTRALCHGCFASVAMIKYDEKHFGKEGVYSTYTSKSRSNTEQNQGRNLGPEPGGRN